MHHFLNRDRELKYHSCYLHTYNVLFILYFLVRDWLALLPPTLAVGGISYVSYQTIKKAREAGNGQINPTIRKDINKVVDFIDIEDITEKASLCRCWRSKNVRYLTYRYDQF